MKGGKAIGDVKAKFQVRMPKGANASYTSTWVKVATVHQSTGIQKLVAYEMAYPDWAKQSTAQKPRS